MSEWISVHQKLPPTVDDYLVQIKTAGGFAKWMDVRTFADGRFRGVSCGDSVTHWMPLPDAPPEPTS